MTGEAFTLDTSLGAAPPVLRENRSADFLGRRYLTDRPKGDAGSLGGEAAGVAFGPNWATMRSVLYVLLVF